MCSTCLLDDIVEKAARELVLDLLLDPPVGAEIRDVGPFNRACATCEDSYYTPIPSEDDGPGVATIRKLAAPLVVGQDSDLDGGLHDAVFVVGAGEGLKTVSAANSGPRRLPVANPFFTTSRHLSPWTSRCWGSRISSSWTTPWAWRRPSEGYL